MGLDAKVDFGAVGDGVADDTAALQALLDAGRAGGDAFLPTGCYRITDTLVMQDTQCLNLYGEGRTCEVANVEVRWDGPEGGTAVLMDGVRDTRVAGLCLRDGSARFGIGIDYDYCRPPAAGMTVPTLCRFESLQVRNTLGYGLLFMNRYKHNGELMTLSEVSCVQDTYTPGTAGIMICSPNAMGYKLAGGLVLQHEIGIKLDGGSFISWGFNFQANSVDVDVVNLSGPLTLIGTQQENSWMLLRTGATAAPGPIEFDGLRSAVAEGRARGDQAGRYVFYGMGGPFTLRNCTFASGPGGYDPEWHVQVGVHEGWNQSGCVVEGCHFPGPDPVQYGQPPSPAYPGRDSGWAKAFGRVNTGSTPAGEAVPLPDFER